MNQVQGIKLELDSDEESFRVLDSQSRICNFLYNKLLEKANTGKDEYKKTGDQDLAKIVYSKRGLRNCVPSMKKDFSFLKSVHSSPLKNVALQVSNSIQSHQKGKKGKRKDSPGWPRYRSWRKKWTSLFYDEPNKGFKVLGSSLELSLGANEQGKRLHLRFRLKESYRLEGVIKNLRITKEHNTYYAVFTVEIPITVKKPVKRIIALDPNHKNLAYGVDKNNTAIEIEAPCWLKQYDKRCDELKSRRDRCEKKSVEVIIKDSKGNPITKYQKPSKQWRKRDITYKKALRKRREQTKTFMYTCAHKLFKTYDCVGIGDYTPHGNGITTAMRRAMNNRSLIGRFKETLEWVAIKSGKFYFEFDETGTTRTCHKCRFTHPEGLHPSIRSWTCPCCKSEHIRDENAAKNGLRILENELQKMGVYAPEVPCLGLDSEMDRWAWRVVPSGVLVTPRGYNGEKSQRQEMKSKTWCLRPTCSSN